MIVAVLWINSLLACALMTLSLPIEDISSDMFRPRVSTHDSNGLPSASQKKRDADQVTIRSPSDSLDTHYGAHRIDRTVLFPHDTTWCLARPISQVIEGPGCMPRTIQNKMCAGQCYSYTVPKIFPHDARSHFKSCDCCQPSRVTWAIIPLSCNAVDGNTILHKHVEIVEECECRPCSLYTTTSSSSTIPTTTYETEYSEESSFVENSSNP